MESAEWTGKQMLGDFLLVNSLWRYSSLGPWQARARLTGELCLNRERSCTPTCATGQPGHEASHEFDMLMSLVRPSSLPALAQVRDPSRVQTMLPVRHCCLSAPAWISDVCLAVLPPSSSSSSFRPTRRPSILLACWPVQEPVNGRADRPAS